MSIVNEPFLVNPPGRKKKSAGSMDSHRALVFGPKGGPWHRSHKSKRKLAKLVNPFGGSLMIAGLNPRRRHGKKKHSRKHAGMHMGTHLGALSLFGRGHKRHNKHRRHHRRNPALSLGGFGRTIGLNKITGNVGNIVVGGVALVMTPVLANMTGLTGGAAWRKYGVETAVVLGGSALLGLMGPTRKYSGAWVIGGAAGIAAELLRQYVIPLIPGMSAFKGYDNYTPGYPAFGPGYVPLESLSGYDGLGYDTLGAFPGQGYQGIEGDGFGAFPGEEAAYTPFIPEEGTSVY